MSTTRYDYRVCSRPSAPGMGLQIHEIYYDELGNIVYYSDDPVSPFGDIEEELYYNMCKMMDAFDKQVIDLDAIDKLFEISGP